MALVTSLETWVLWQQSPVTQDYRSELERLCRREEALLGRGECLDPESAERTLARVARAVGRLEGLRLALYLQPEIEMEEKADKTY